MHLVEPAVVNETMPGLWWSLTMPALLWYDLTVSLMSQRIFTKWRVLHEAGNHGSSSMNFQRYTSLFVLIAPIAILLIDFIVYWLYGYDATITGVVRSWAEKSTWPMFIYIIGTVILGLHFFTGWPN